MTDVAALDEAAFTVLNALMLKRMASTEQLAVLVGAGADVVETQLADAQAQGLVMSMPSGHLLLPEGTAAVQAWYREHYAATRVDPALEQWYARFETLNTRFIALLTAYQQGGGDDDTLYKALDVVEQLVRALGALLPQVPRYADYQRRFEAASAAIEDGDRDLLCNPRRDSAHNVWFEFHEDILNVLGRPRDTT